MEAVRRYFAELSAATGAAWNRFWFTPRTAATLGVIRMAVGSLAFYSIATYGPDLERWFGPGGMLPTSMIRGMYENQPSLLDNLPPQMLWPAFWASLAAIGLFTLGVGGRIVAVLATVATLSFFSRAPILTGEFEPVLAFLLAYLCVGRAGDEFSLMALIRRGRGRPGSLGATPSAQSPVSPFNTVSLRLIQIHIAIVHLMMALAQLAAPESAWWNGEGIYLAMTRPGMSLLDYTNFTEHPRVVAAWSHLITIYLLTFPALVWNRLARPLVLAVGILVWLSLALATGWLMFAAVMLTGLAAFIDLDSAPRR